MPGDLNGERQSQWMKSGGRGVSGRGSSMGKGFEVSTERSEWASKWASEGGSQ